MLQYINSARETGSPRDGFRDQGDFVSKYIFRGTCTEKYSTSFIPRDLTSRLASLHIKPQGADAHKGQ